MTNNTGGSDDKGVSENPLSSTSVPPPSPTSQSPATPVSGSPANPTAASTGTDTSSSAGGSRAGVANPTTASTGIVSADTGFTRYRGATVPPKKRESMSPVSGSPANHTTASTGNATSSGTSAGGSHADVANRTTASTGIVINPSASAGGSRYHGSTVPPRKRGSMLAACEGSSRGGGVVDPRNVRPNMQAAAVVQEERRRCVLCRMYFSSAKALFGHMNAHKGRGWKGAYPPPTFNRKEEFADLQAQMEPDVKVAGEPVAVLPKKRNVLPGLNATKPSEEKYQLPDLNLPPPAEE